MDKNKYNAKNTCSFCHISFDRSIVYCPQCNREVKIRTNDIIREGTGRKYGAGGDACNYCSFCYGSSNWCPYLD